jgi:hypothetical protein
MTFMSIRTEQRHFYEICHLLDAFCVNNCACVICAALWRAIPGYVPHSTTEQRATEYSMYLSRSTTEQRATEYSMYLPRSTTEQRATEYSMYLPRSTTDHRATRYRITAN